MMLLKWLQSGNLVLSNWRRHCWLHHMTDEIPPEVAPAEVQENLTHTPAKYVPYSTTVAKIAAWKPKRD